jgi:hypothetical protein
MARSDGVQVHAEDDAARQREQRRAFIRTHHPDLGGDPVAFVDGLRRWEEATRGRLAPTGGTVVRSGSRRPESAAPTTPAGPAPTAYRRPRMTTQLLAQAGQASRLLQRRRHPGRARRGGTIRSLYARWRPGRS